MDDGNFDVIILGTGLTESITAAALSKAGFRVAHIDTNPYYGADEASLSLEELIQWANERSSDAGVSSPHLASQRSRFTSVSCSPSTLPQSRQYSLSLSPSIIPSTGPLISSLVSSGVSRYGGFRLLERVGIFDPSGIVKNVPGSKEDVFKNKSISLLERRRLMRFLMFAVGEFEGKKELEGKEDIPFYEFLKTVFSLSDEMAGGIAYSLTYCFASTDPTLEALHRIRRYLRSAGRYGPSPFLVGHYGGAGEIAQGFCRTAAVSGAIYILGRSISTISHSSGPSTEQPNAPEAGQSDSIITNLSPRYTIQLDDFPEPLTCDVLISSPTHVPAHLAAHTKVIPPSVLYEDTHKASPIARCIAIIDRPLSFLSPPPPPTDEPESGSTLATEQEQEAPAGPPLEIDTAVLVFPPSSLPGGSTTASATILITGEGTMSTPKGKWIVYFALPLFDPLPQSKSPESLLQPYLDATLRLSSPSYDVPTPIQPLFTLFYIQHPCSPHPPSTSPSIPSPSSYILTPPPSSYLPESLDSAATNAEAVFWEAVSILKLSPRVLKRKQVEGLRKQVSEGDGINEAEADEVETFWPSLDTQEEEAEVGEW